MEASSNSGNTPGSAASGQIQAQNQELVNALRKAYPDMESTPPDVKGLIEKAEQNNIHASTRALSKALRALTDALEARKKHRVAWMDYLKEGLQAWESSLVGYLRHQTSLKEAASKARMDIAAARQAVELNAKTRQSDTSTSNQGRVGKERSRGTDAAQIDSAGSSEEARKLSRTHSADRIRRTEIWTMLRRFRTARKIADSSVLAP